MSKYPPRSSPPRGGGSGYAGQAAAGLKARLPALDAFQNQYRGYTIKIEMPEFTSICPKTGLPDFGTLTLEYLPARLCVELKSLKYYILAYRNLGIFYENAVNRVLDDVARAVKPVWAIVTGEFHARGGMRSTIVARYPRKNRSPQLARSLRGSSRN